MFSHEGESKATQFNDCNEFNDCNLLHESNAFVRFSHGGGRKLHNSMNLMNSTNSLNLMNYFSKGGGRKLQFNGLNDFLMGEGERY